MADSTPDRRVTVNAAALAALVDIAYRFVELHAQVQMDTPEAKAQHARAVDTMRESLTVTRGALDIRALPGPSEQADALDAALDETAVLVEPPGDLREQMAEAIRSHDIDESRADWWNEIAPYCVCGEQVSDWDEHAAKVAASVRWEDAARRIAAAEARADEAEGELSNRDHRRERWAHERSLREAAEAQVAALQRDLAEVQTERDTNFSVLQRVTKGGWEAATELVNERIARKQAEAKLTAAKRAVYAAQTAHIREARHERPVVGDCAVCCALLAISRDLPSRPDDPEEIRRLAGEGQ